MKFRVTYTMKICSKCQEPKEDTDFSGRSRYCRPCRKTHKRLWLEANRDRVNAYRREYEKHYYQTQSGKACRRKKTERIKQRIENDPEFAARQYARKKRGWTAQNKKVRATPGGRVRNLLSSRMRRAIKNAKKSESTMQLTGISLDGLRAHLESLWQPGMTWENHGLKGWHIDHILPCASFDLSDPEQQRKCFHYSNLQPLWAIDNIRKKDKLPLDTEAPGLGGPGILLSVMG